MNAPIDDSGPRRGDGPSDPKIALRPKDAASLLGISERLLWTLTNNGTIPHARLGRAVVYPRRMLERWIEDRAGEARR